MEILHALPFERTLLKLTHCLAMSHQDKIHNAIISYNMLMDKEILQHRDFVEAELKRIDKKYSNDRSKERLEELTTLLRYHEMEVRNFQHERHVHLLVTITFGFIAIGSWAALFGWLVMSDGSFDIVTWLMIAIAALLTILEAAYLRFYYHLENWTQKLYYFDKKIYDEIVVK